MTPQDREAELAKRFNGVIQTDEGPVTVHGGFAIIDKEVYMVSDDGVVVTDKEGIIVAVISGGRAHELTPEIINQLRSKGYIK